MGEALGKRIAPGGVMRVKRAITMGAAATCAAATVWIYRAFRRDMECAQRRISNGNRVIRTRHGFVEYVDEGAGFPLLVIHGAGGGFDQLRDVAQSLQHGNRGFRTVFVSRFGYLGSSLPEKASTAAQAEAYAELLDRLNIDKVGVIAVSAGAASGLQFATAYPERCAALALLVPAAYSPGLPVTAPSAPPLTAWFRDTLLRSDFAFWLATKIAAESLTENILGTPRRVATRVDVSERRRLRRTLLDILPVSMRRAGLMNDAQVVTHLAQVSLDRIRMPVLLVSAEDDGYGTFRSARYLKSQIRQAKLVMFPDGGHLWAGHNAEFQNELSEFLQPLTVRADK